MQRSRVVTVTFAAVLAAALGAAPDAAGQGAPVPPAPSPTPTASAPQAVQPTYVPCREAKLIGEGVLDVTRRDLWEMLCSASLWFDGLFGRYGSLEAAEQVSGRAELSGLRTNLEGTKVKTGLDVNVRLPHLEQRLNAFFGRSDPQDYVRDRQEGFGLRSDFVSLESEEKWLAGLGYSLPGAVGERVSLRTGVAGGVNATVFGQAIYRQSFLAGGRDLWHLREVAFWRSREGFGFTSNVDWDHVVSKTLLLRWGTVGTVSEGTHGVDWRSVLVLYQNLHESRAMAYEAFARGVTGTLGLTEYGGRLIYRQSVFRSFFYVNVLGGYSWLRLSPDEPHHGTITVGLGGELWFGPPLP